MDLVAIAKAAPDIIVSIRLGDLLDANEALVRKVRQEVEKEQTERDRKHGDHLIPREEARRMLGSPDPSTMWRWEGAGLLHKVKIGVKVFYRSSEIDAIINSKETH